MKHLVTLVAVIGVGLAVTQIQGGGDDKKLPLDKEFLVRAAVCNNAEIEVSKLADKRADSSLVKDYARNVQKDHQAAAEKIGDLMKVHKVGAVVGLEKDTQDAIKRLSSLEGRDFDQAFLKQMVDDHVNAIALFENQAKKGTQKDICELATALTQDLRRHLQKAQELIQTTGK
jgi:putative membrane protein